MMVAVLCAAFAWGCSDGSEGRVGPMAGPVASLEVSPTRVDLRWIGDGE